MYAEDNTNGTAIKGNATLNQSHGSFELVLSPVILGLLGYLLDRQLGTQYVLTVIAVILGLVGATIKIIVEYKARMVEAEAGAPWKLKTTDVTATTEQGSAP